MKFCRVLVCTVRSFILRSSFGHRPKAKASNRPHHHAIQFCPGSQSAPYIEAPHRNEANSLVARKILGTSLIVAIALVYLLFSSLRSLVHAGALGQSNDEIHIVTHIFTADGRYSYAPVEQATQSAPLTASVGSLVTFTVWISNSSVQAMQDVQLVDVLPESGIGGIRCVDAYHPQTDATWETAESSLCNLVESPDLIPDPLGGFTTVTQTQSITWTIKSIEANSSWSASFVGQITGIQSQGSDTIENVLYANYNTGEVQKNASVRTYIQAISPADGKSLLAQLPSWLSSDLGGALSSDWGDFDLDGDLDLALALTVGTSVYRNVDGYLELFWEEQEYGSLGVRWADINQDFAPELIVIGAVDETSTEQSEALKPGQNRVYKFDPGATLSAKHFQVDHIFTSSHQLARLEAGDFTADGYIDVIGGTNAINPTCPVHLFQNDGSGTLVEGPCISTSASAAFGPGDVDNDNDLDLAIGQFPNQIRLLLNDGTGNFSSQPAIQIDSAVQFLPYDLSWGDYDRDGFLDLAAAFPLQRETRIYRNAGTGSDSDAGDSAFDRPIVIRSTDFMTPLSIDWGDFDGDGYLDLAVADVPPTIYSYVSSDATADRAANSSDNSAAFVPIHEISESTIRGQVWSIRAVDLNGNGSVELSISDRSGPSLFYENLRPKLARTRISIPNQIGFNSTPASSIAWGDFDSDGDLDLVVGAGDSGPGAPGAKFYPNSNGTFQRNEIQLTESAVDDNLDQSIALADADGDGALDLAVGSPKSLLLYRADDRDNPAGRLNVAVSALAWGDADGDGQLELLVASTASTTIYHVDLSQPSAADVFRPLWSAPSVQVPSSVAWADYNRDGFLDFVVAHADGPVQLYCNSGDNLFSADAFLSAWQSDGMQTGDIAWGDANGDGWVDLALGNTGGANKIYQNELAMLLEPNQGSGQSTAGCAEQAQVNASRPLFVDVWSSSEISRTTAVAWGDVDNDGDLDLAVGNDGDVDLIYTSDEGTWTPRWWSAERLETTDLAWGDLDGDGDLDLAVSQEGQEPNGYYLNTYVSPSHLEADYLQAMPLPQQPAYIGMRRPGNTADAYFHSTPEILSGPQAPNVDIPYELFDPDGARDTAAQNTKGSHILETQFEYSLWGNEWHKAVAHTANPSIITETARLGANTLFQWNAQANDAVGDNVRFRVTTIESAPSGGVQRVKSSAVSPPFRVRGTTCIWPEQPEILVQQRRSDDESWKTLDNQLPAPIPSFKYAIEAADDEGQATDVQLRFIGKLGAGTGAMSFQWEFAPAIMLRSGDTVTQTVGQLVEAQTNALAGYDVNLTISGEPCPLNRPRYAQAVIGAGAPFRSDQTYAPVYIPLMLNAGASSVSGSSAPGYPLQASTLTGPTPPHKLTSILDAGNRSIQIKWDSDLEHKSTNGFRIYRFPIDQLFDSDDLPKQAQQLAQLTASARSFEDFDARCGMGYYVTAIGLDGESAPSASTIYGWPCND